MGERWRAMDSAPRDGREVLARLPRSRVFLRLAWVDGRWVCGAVPMAAESGGWAPLEEGRIAGLILGDC